MTWESDTLDEGDDVVESTDGAAARPVSASLPRSGARISRYLVIRELGAGTMGVVYAAHDPELDRKVAIKLLTSRRQDQAASRARLQREAQALAKLNHRNVVGVYDVGVHDGQLFLAMEFVEGQTLRAWMGTEPKPWPEVLRVLCEAGRGLAAAHDAGLVHRDFKPDNVMLETRGRVRVMDFGLARSEMHTDEEPASAVSSTDLDVLGQIFTGDGGGDGQLTQSGVVMGTPGYMARELFRGDPADARSDQFAFCVTLYEALYGERPFPGRNVAELLHALADGDMRPVPRHVRVPPWLHRIVLRGLSSAPEARFASMRDLLEALVDGPRRRRRRWLAALGASAALGAGIWAGLAALEDARRCSDLDVELHEIWTDTRRRELAVSFENSGLSYSRDARERVEQGLDDYARAWSEARLAACEAERSGEQSPAQVELRVACLGQHLQQLRATIELLCSADAATVDRAVEVVTGLPRIDRCADVDVLAIDAPPVQDTQPTERAAVLAAQLAEAEVLERAGKYRGGLEVTARVVAGAQELHDERLLARARVLEGILLRRAGDYEASEAALVQAYELAEGLRMSAEAAEAAATLVFVVGYRLARHEDGRRWAVHAKALARAAGTDEAQALYLNNIGAVAYGAGQFDAAREDWEQALEIRERAHGPTHPKVAGSLNNLGVLAHAVGDYEGAKAYHERALAIWAGALGEAHPQTAYSLNHLGRVALEQGRYDEARVNYERALEIREQALGPEHTLVADTLDNLGRLAEREGDHASAASYHARTLPIYEASLGPTHPSVAVALTERGRALYALGQLDEAARSLERALEILEAIEGDPTRLARARFALAQILWDLSPGDRERALALAGQARDAYFEAGDKSAQDLAEVDGWRRRHHRGAALGG